MYYHVDYITYVCAPSSTASFPLKHTCSRSFVSCFRLSHKLPDAHTLSKSTTGWARKLLVIFALKMRGGTSILGGHPVLSGEDTLFFLLPVWEEKADEPREREREEREEREMMRTWIITAHGKKRKHALPPTLLIRLITMARPQQQQWLSLSSHSPLSPHSLLSTLSFANGERDSNTYSTPLSYLPYQKCYCKTYPCKNNVQFWLIAALAQFLVGERERGPANKDSQSPVHGLTLAKKRIL